jgi:galactitol-specific phosphotransferase system IIC component
MAIDAFHRGLMVAAAFAAINVVLAVIAPRIEPSTEQLTEAATA